MERGEIWMVSLDPTLGHEQRGHRPVLLVTPGTFNRAGVPAAATRPMPRGVLTRADRPIRLTTTHRPYAARVRPRIWAPKYARRDEGVHHLSPRTQLRTGA